MTAPAPTQIASTSPGSVARPELIALVTAYDETLALVAAPQAVYHSLPWNRRIAFVVTRPLAHVLLVRHVHRTLQALACRLYARAAIASEPSPDEEADLVVLQRYRQSLPAAWWYRRAPLIVAAAGSLIAYALANHVFRTPEARLLGDLTTATLTLDRGGAVRAVSNSTLENTGGAVVILMWSLWVVLFLPLLAFRLKRVLFALYPDAERGLATASAPRGWVRTPGVYELERKAYAPLGRRPPSEVPLDLVTQGILAVSILCFGAGTILYGVTNPSGAQQVTGLVRYLLGGGCVALSAAALAGLAGAVRLRYNADQLPTVLWQRHTGWLDIAVAIVFIALVALALASR
jgi:hypothetical protein